MSINKWNNFGNKSCIEMVHFKTLKVRRLKFHSIWKINRIDPMSKPFVGHTCPGESLDIEKAVHPFADLHFVNLFCLPFSPPLLILFLLLFGCWVPAHQPENMHHKIVINILMPKVIANGMARWIPHRDFPLASKYLGKTVATGAKIIKHSHWAAKNKNRSKSSVKSEQHKLKVQL